MYIYSHVSPIITAKGSVFDDFYNLYVKTLRGMYQNFVVYFDKMLDLAIQWVNPRIFSDISKELEKLKVIIWRVSHSCSERQSWPLTRAHFLPLFATEVSPASS